MESNQTNSNETMTLSAEMLDYVEMGLLALMVFVGCPINILSFLQTLGLCTNFICNFSARNMGRNRKRGRSRKGKVNGRRGSTHQSASSTRSTLLKLHLTAANLLIILVYGVSQISWLATFSWLGGDILCRFIKFFDTFCFYATSNIVVVIGIERVTVALFVDQPRIVSKHKNKLRYVAWLPWIFAAVCSAPQFYIWHQYAPYETMPDWNQCVTHWMIWKMQMDENSEEYARIQFHEALYNGIHLILVFWLPALIVLLCYAVILMRFQQHIRKSTKEAMRTQWAANAHQFRKRAASFHKSTTGTGLSPPMSSTCNYENDDSTTGTSSPQMAERTVGTSVTSLRKQVINVEQQRKSAAILLEVPTVLNSSQILVFQQKSNNVAVLTLTRAKKKTIKTTAWILSAYIACWTPYNVLELCRYLDHTMESRYLELLSNLIVLNAVLNPLIYKM